MVAEALRERVARFLADHSSGVLSAVPAPGASRQLHAGALGEDGPGDGEWHGEGSWALPVRYWSRGDGRMEVDCLVPRWADAAYYLQRSPRALLVVADGEDTVAGGRTTGLRWLQCAGTVSTVDDPVWAELLPPGPLGPVQSAKGKVQSEWGCGFDVGSRLGPPARQRYRPDDLYLVLRLVPDRVDLVNEVLGWGYRENLDL
jgi:hypothetical protein